MTWSTPTSRCGASSSTRSSAEQLDVAASFAPTITTFHAGPNDVLRRGTDLDDLFRRYDAAVARVAASSDRVILFTSIGRAGGTGRLAQFLADRFARFNRNVREVGARHGALVVDLEPVQVLTDRRLWDSDRLHLNADGHRRVAAAVLEQLDVRDPDLLGGEPGWWREPLPPRPPTTTEGRPRHRPGLGPRPPGPLGDAPDQGHVQRRRPRPEGPPAPAGGRLTPVR